MILMIWKKKGKFQMLGVQHGAAHELPGHNYKFGIPFLQFNILNVCFSFGGVRRWRWRILH
jgi:hypothetical protein